MNDDKYTNVKEEIASLRSDLRRSRRILWSALLAGSTILGLVGSQPDKKPGTIEATRIVLRGSKGNAIAELTSDALGLPMLRMFDTVGIRRVELGLTEDEVELSFNDPEGAATIAMTTLSGISSTFAMIQPGRKSILMAVGSDDVASIDLGSVEGAVECSMGVSKTHADIYVSKSGDPEAGPTAAIGAETGGSTFVRLTDVKLQERLVLEEDKKGKTKVEIYDSNKKVLFKAP